jgi:metallophosphoesterase (TIGR03767 family)
MRLWAGLGAACLLALAGVAIAAAEDTTDKSTLEQTIVPSGPGFRQLTLGAGEPNHVTRPLTPGIAGANRATTRSSVAYFAQLSDFQLADEESPARVEFLDSAGSPFESAWRPWEAMEVHIDDAMIRQVNEFSDEGPVAEGDGDLPAMDFSINTGDSADSQQLNETRWVRQVIEGGEIDPNSGIDPTGYAHPLCGGAIGTPLATEFPLYTGVQDASDFVGTPPTPPNYFYDPDNPAGPHTGWPTWAGLMDRAQEPFQAEGLTAPHYASFGNHDGLVQGSMGGNEVIEQVATGCVKPLTGEFPNSHNILFGNVTLQDVIDLRQANPERTMLVPPDPDRQFVSKEQYKDEFRAGGDDDAHGFDHIDPAEEAASDENAGYYSFNPEGVDDLRMIALDTVSEGGNLDSANGNLDDPQFRWLERELQEARDQGELVILFSHHAPASMTAGTTDEFAGPCSGVPVNGHDKTVSCDIDPRVSTPLHLGETQSGAQGEHMVSMLKRYPNVIGWVAGHSHTNKVEPKARADGYGFWVVRTAAEADWPQQARLLQLFDNEDDTLSLFGTIIDHESYAAAPAGPASTFGDPLLDSDLPSDLASVARTISYNDLQAGNCGGGPCGAGEPADRNVELLVKDPRVLPAAPPVPAIQASLPGSPADDPAPELRGAAEANSTVTIYESPSCAGTPEASGAAAAFAAGGLTASVADGAATTFTATATDAHGNVSGCSAPFAYQEVATPAAPVKPKCKKPKKKKKKGKKKKRKKCRR